MGTRFDPTTGGLIFTQQEKDNEIIVKTAADLEGAIDSGKVYFIDGFIDITSIDEIVVPTGGMYIGGHGYGISGLYRTDNNKTLFKTESGSYAGDFIVEGVTLYVTGAGSKIFDLDNDNNNSAFELNTCNLGVFGAATTSLGTVANYRQVRTANFAVINYNDGFTFDGDFDGMAFNDSILLANVAGTTFLQEGTSLVINDGFSSNFNALPLSATSEFCDFDAANFATGAVMSLNNFRTAANDAIPNIQSNNIKALFKNCIGVDNTFVAGSWKLTTETATSIVLPNTLYKLAGTTTESLEAHFTSPSNNRLQYNGEKTIKVDILGYIQIETGSTESLEIEVRQWDSSASSWVNLQSLPVETQLKLLGDRRGATGIVTNALLDTGDYIEVWIKNISNTNNPTAVLGATLTVKERS